MLNDIFFICCFQGICNTIVFLLLSILFRLQVQFYALSSTIPNFPVHYNIILNICDGCAVPQIKVD